MTVFHRRRAEDVLCSRLGGESFRKGFLFIGEQSTVKPPQRVVERSLKKFSHHRRVRERFLLTKVMLTQVFVAVPRRRTLTPSWIAGLGPAILEDFSEVFSEGF